MDTFNITDNSTLSTESGSDGSEFEEYCSSQCDSLFSENNCFSYHTDEPSNTNIGLTKSKKSVNFLQKLYFRETRGNFSSHPRAPNLRLFNSVPAENKICLQQVLPESAFHTNHVFLGLSKCGQFLLSYTHSIELDVIIFNNVHKYRLHWWSFVPHQRARKVAEVMLFGNQGVYCDLHISVCQWPIDTTKLLVYGYCVHTDHCQFGHSHLTITTVPSLNTCRDCLKVAASYEEEDLAAIWDSCVRFTCLKHGLTIHSNFDVVSPYPKFDPQVSMKRDGVVFFNTGNFLHVLRADLEHFGGGTTAPTPDPPQTTQRCPPPPPPTPYKNLGDESDLRGENPVNFLGEFLENCNNNNDSIADSASTRIDRLKQEIEEGKIEGRKLAEELDGESRRFWSTLEEMKNSIGPVEEGAPDAFQRLKNGNGREEPEQRRDPLTQRERAVRDFQVEVFSGRRRAEAGERYEVATSGVKRKKTDSADEDEDVDRTSRNFADKPSDVSNFVPGTLAMGVPTADVAHDKPDDVYVMSSLFDSSMELNITCSGTDEPKVPVKSGRSLLMVSTADAEERRKPEARKEVDRKSRKPRGTPVKIGNPPATPSTPPKVVVAAAETVYEFTDDQPDNSEKLSSYRRRRLAEKKYEFCEEEGEDAENIVPFRLLRNQLRPAPRGGGDGTPPRSPDPTPLGDGDKAVLRPLNRNLVAAVTLLSPREADRDWSPKSGLRKVPLIEAAGDGCLADALAYQKSGAGRDDVQTGAGYARTRCTVQFKRRYIEVDDELVSTTTDIEDDDCIGSTGYHFALPLEIHGAGYVQLQMISNSKADKLVGASGVTVHQMSFDVEAFCHETAQRLCEAAGKKYCFCVDYDVEIIDVCIITGDVLVLAIMRIEAIIVSKGLAKSLRRGEILVSGQRNQYQGSCTFVWNTDSGAHKVVATSPLCESSAMDDSQEPWGPAKSHVQTLRKTFPQVPMCHAVRAISNRPVFAEESYKCLSDLDNLIDLVL